MTDQNMQFYSDLLFLLIWLIGLTSIFAISAAFHEWYTLDRKKGKRPVAAIGITILVLTLVVLAGRTVANAQPVQPQCGDFSASPLPVAAYQNEYCLRAHLATLTFTGYFAVFLDGRQIWPTDPFGRLLELAQNTRIYSFATRADAVVMLDMPAPPECILGGTEQPLTHYPSEQCFRDHLKRLDNRAQFRVHLDGFGVIWPLLPGGVPAPMFSPYRVYTFVKIPSGAIRLVDLRGGR